MNCRWRLLLIPEKITTLAVRAGTAMRTNLQNFRSVFLAAAAVACCAALSLALDLLNSLAEECGDWSFSSHRYGWGCLPYLNVGGTGETQPIS